jgi:biotin carboxylase
VGKKQFGLAVGMLRSAAMAAAKAKILIVMPTMWDARQLQACAPAWQDRFEIVLGEPSDAECTADFDVMAYIGRMAARKDLAGVFSSSDYPGASVAAAIANEAGVPSPHPRDVLRATHKLASRQMQQASVPEATPRYCVIDPDDLSRAPEVGFPCFVKPIKGAFSMFARRVDTQVELVAHLDRPEVREFREYFLGIFNTLWRHYVGEPVDGRFFIAEEVLNGVQVTVEGFVGDGEPTVIGVVDSEFHPGTGSFSRFVYPSSLPAKAQEQMADIARRCIAGMNLRHCFFNIEMSWDGKRAAIIEVNPRICGQFGDLYEKVDGVNAYAVALDLVTGGNPGWKRGKGPFNAAASVPLRLFHPTKFDAVPDADRVAEIEAEFPGTIVWNEIQAGQAVESFVFEDGASFRYCVFNIGADSRAALQALQRNVTKALNYGLSTLESPTR